MQQSPSWEANRFSASQKFSNYGIRRFITEFTRAHHLSLSWARSIQSTYGRSILILSSHLCHSLSSGFFTSGFPAKTLYTPFLSPIHATCLAHLILHDLITQITFGDEYRSLSSLLRSLLHYPVTLSLLGPLWFYSVFCSWDMTMYVVLSVFISSPVSFLQTSKASVFFLTGCTVLPSILTSA